MDIGKENGDDAASILTVLPPYGAVDSTRPLRPGSPTPSYHTVDPTTTIPVRTRLRNPLKRIFSRSSRRAPDIPPSQNLTPQPSPAILTPQSPVTPSSNVTPTSAQATGAPAIHPIDIHENMLEDRRLGQRLHTVLWEARPGQEALHRGMFLAVRSNCTYTLRTFLDYAGNSSTLNPGDRKLLHVAISEHAETSLLWLLRNGASISDTNEYQRTAVHEAAGHGSNSLKIVLDHSGKSLIDHPDRLGNTPLHWAAALGLSENVTILIDYGADINAANNKGQRPIHLAAESCLSRNTVQVLINRGADLACLTKLNESPLHLAFRLNDKERRNSRMNDVRRFVVIDLINASPRSIINLRNKKGLTPLHLAIALQNLACVQKLVNAGADIEARTPEGHSPLQLNACSGDNTQNSAIADCLKRVEAVTFERASIGQSSSAP